jgi:thiol:disulfide interchange protein
MIRERALEVVLVIVGILFLAMVYPLVQMHLEESLQMMLSIYVTLGIFLLLASRNPEENRSLIAFAAWSSLAHAGVMAVQSSHDVGDRIHLLGGAVAFAVIGIAFIVLAPANLQVPDHDSPRLHRTMSETNKA